MENKLFKIRSVSACLSAAYSLLTSNFKTLFKRLWLPGLALALSLGIYMLSAMSIDNPQVVQGAGVSPAGVIGMALSLAAVVVCLFWFYAWLLPMLNSQSPKWNLVRLIKFAVAYLIFLIVITLVAILVMVAVSAGTGAVSGGISSGGAIVLTFICVLVFCVALIVILIPLVYTVMKYLMEPKMSLWAIVGKPYKTGFRHWGFIFGSLFLSYIIYYVIYLVAFIPVIILAVACYINGEGMLSGDPSGMPGILSVALVLVCTLSFFVIVFVSLWQLFVGYYVYGSIEARESMKNGPFVPQPEQVEGPDDTTKALEA
jgi:hypothetical protein